MYNDAGKVGRLNGALLCSLMLSIEKLKVWEWAGGLLGRMNWSANLLSTVNASLRYDCKFPVFQINSNGNQFHARSGPWFAAGVEATFRVELPARRFNNVSCRLPHADAGL